MLQSCCKLFHNFAADNPLEINTYSRFAAMLQSFADIYASIRARTRIARTWAHSAKTLQLCSRLEIRAYYQ